MIRRGTAEDAAGSWVDSRLRFLRRYGADRSTIESATHRRLSGDWRGACEAAGVTVTFDPVRLPRRYGRSAGRRIENDLRNLAPDLLRWHLAPEQLLRQARLSQRCHDTGRQYEFLVPLARYRLGPRETGWLRVRAGPGPQRLLLELVDSPGAGPLTYYAARHLWDVRRVDELRVRVGGNAERAPFFEPDGTPVVLPDLDTSPGEAAPDDPATRTEWAAVRFGRYPLAAIAAAGIEVPMRPSAPLRSWLRVRRAPDSWLRLRGEADALLADHPEATAVELYRGRNGIVVLDGCRAGRPALRATTRAAGGRAVALCHRMWQRFPELDLVRRGELGADELHPLVRSALFPRRAAAAGVGPSEPPAVTLHVDVDCGGLRHVLDVRDGTLVPRDHPAAELRRERVAHRLGAASAGCFAAVNAWHDRRIDGVPAPLMRLAVDLMRRAEHGNTTGVLHQLDRGVPAGCWDRRGVTLMHLIPLLDHHLVLPRLLAARVDWNVVDRSGRTPLAYARVHHAPHDLVAAMIAAGARDRPTARR